MSIEYYRLTSYILFNKLITWMYKSFYTSHLFTNFLMLFLGKANSFNNSPGGVWCTSEMLAVVSVGCSLLVI